ncbi:septum formation initiator family protein [bacterium]|nr:septum formation initiator family protein [bacterium]
MSSTTQSGPRLGNMMYFALTATLGAYFTFAAVQGDYGVLRQAQTADEMQGLTAERDKLAGELASLKNMTHRLSDNYLDIDLLDEQVRSVLGYVRADEIVIR